MFIRAALSSLREFVRSQSQYSLVAYLSSARRIYPYKKNLTSSLESPLRQLAENNKEPQDTTFTLKFVHAHAALIKEHAIRRTDFFFCQLVSIHNLSEKYQGHVTIKKQPARLQHGNGSAKLLTHACHSALFPHINIVVKQPGKTAKNLTRQYIRTHFYQQLNSTVELPRIVNSFDCQLEGRVKPSFLVVSCLNILNRAANNEIDPRVGMHLFYQCMQQFFSSLQSRYLAARHAKDKAAAKLAILSYQQQGTFAGAKELTIADEYASLLLRLTPEEKLRLQQGDLELAPHYRQIQDEIWNARIPRIG